MTIEEVIKRFNDNAEYERTHGNLQGCLEFRQLAEWLEKLQKIQEILRWNDAPSPYYQDERKTPSFSYGDISDKSQYLKD